MKMTVNLVKTNSEKEEETNFLISSLNKKHNFSLQQYFASFTFSVMFPYNLIHMQK
jgi:hypothetical protein